MIQSSWDDRGQTEGATATITDTAQQVLTTISMPNDGYLNGANANVTLTIQPATAANVMQYHCDLLFGACYSKRRKKIKIIHSGDVMMLCGFGF